MRKANISKHLKALGDTKTKYKMNKPDATLLECFPNPMPPGKFPKDCTVTINCPEFTSLCPKTGQPDFANIHIYYAPDKLCVESKALKLYLMSFRNHGEFHEACVARIAEDLFELLKPKHLEVEGQFTPRGGIPFWPKVVLRGNDLVL